MTENQYRHVRNAAKKKSLTHVIKTAFSYSQSILLYGSIVWPHIFLSGKLKKMAIFKILPKSTFLEENDHFLQFAFTH